MNKESMKIGRYLNGHMQADEKLAFESKLGSDPFLADAVDGYKIDPQALYDLPVFRSSVQLWWAVAGLSTVLFVFFVISQLSDSDPARKAEVYSLPSPATIVIEKHQPAVFKTETVAQEVREQIAKPDIIIPETAIISVVSEKNSEMAYLEAIPIREARVIASSASFPKINQFSSGTFILDLKVAKSADKKPDMWRFEYRENHIPAQFENEQSLHFNQVVIPRFTKVKKPTYEEALTHALSAFKEDDFALCLTILSGIERDRPDDLNVLFYSGLSYYHLGRFTEAVSCFSQTADASNAVFAEESGWYLALSLWKLGNKTEARNMFSQIRAEGGFYAERAAKMEMKQME